MDFTLSLSGTSRTTMVKNNFLALGGSMLVGESFAML
jgi:hypothetical protein